MATNIDGKAFAAKIRSQVKEDADNLIAKKQIDPCLAVVLVGENPASKVYVGAKTKMAYSHLYAEFYSIKIFSESA